MIKKIVGIFVCMLLILSVIPIVNSLDKNLENDNYSYNRHDKIITDNDCGCGQNSNSISRNPKAIKFNEPIKLKEASPKPQIIFLDEYRESSE